MSKKKKYVVRGYIGIMPPVQCGFNKDNYRVKSGYHNAVGPDEKIYDTEEAALAGIRILIGTKRHSDCQDFCVEIAGKGPGSLAPMRFR